MQKGNSKLGLNIERYFRNVDFCIPVLIPQCFTYKIKKPREDAYKPQIQLQQWWKMKSGWLTFQLLWLIVDHILDCFWEPVFCLYQKLEFLWQKGWKRQQDTRKIHIKSLSKILNKLQNIESGSGFTRLSSVFQLSLNK